MALKLLLCLLFVVTVVSADPTTAPPQAAEGTTTTTAPGGTTTTTAPGGTTTTTAPGGTTTTTAPGGTTTTTAPGGTTTTTAPGGTTTTTAPGGTTTTAPGGTTTTTASTPTTAKPDACKLSPCKGGSTCVNRGVGYECLCLTGDYYKDAACVAAKVFPGELTYTGTYNEKMADTTSAEFKIVADKIVAEINEVYNPKLKSVVYLGSTVTKLSDKATATNIMTRTGNIFATVDIKFDPLSEITAAEVVTKISTVGKFEGADLCEREENPCDETAQCENGKEGSYVCKCKDKYIKTSFSDRICVACEKGKKAVDGECVGCGFGYSGFNCEDDWQLILVIVGTIFGALLVVTTALIPVMAMKAKKKSKKGKVDHPEKSYQNPAHIKPAQTNGSALPRPIPLQTAPGGGRPGFGGNNVPRIPRATANESWERGNLDRVPSNSQQNLIPGRNSRQFEDHDSNQYGRPVKSQNPYLGGRPQTNPYASNQGHSNPYFRNDEGRRY